MEMGEKLRILIVDDNVMIRDLIRDALSKLSGFHATSIEMNDLNALEQAFTEIYDVVLIDIDTPDCDIIEVIQTIMALQPSARIVALTTHTEFSYISQIFESGAVGFVPKKAAFTELLRAIATVVKHKIYFSPLIGLQLVHPVNVIRYDTPLGKLSRRQREILSLIAKGKTIKEIARALGLSIGTVHLHRRNLTTKLGIDSVADLTKYAIRRGLISMDSPDLSQSGDKKFRKQKLLQQNTLQKAG